LLDRSCIAVSIGRKGRRASSGTFPETDTKLKASYGTGFKAPTLRQLYQDFPAFDFFANPNLKPEESTGYDVARFGSTNDEGSASGTFANLSAIVLKLAFSLSHITS
jgi:outer membrane cobalamin receptor